MLTTIQLFKRLPTAYMESEGSLSHSQEHAIDPYPELKESSPQLSILSVLFLSDFSIKILYAFFFSHMCPTCPTHLGLLDLLR